MSGPKPKYNPKEYASIISKVYEGKVIVVDPYVRQQTQILHRCNECLTEWRVSPSSLLTPNGAKKAAFGCPNCCKGNITKVALSEESFRNQLHGRKYADGIIQPDIKVSGEYRGINIHMDFECLDCGSTDKVTPKALLNKKYLCTCVNGRSADSIRSKESRRLSYLYKKAFLNIDQLSALAGYSTAILRTVGERDGWIAKQKNRFKADRLHRRQKFITSDFTDRKKQYNRHARNLTRIISDEYAHILDPDDKRGKEFSLDHMLSIHEAYVNGPADLRFICHPANLQLLSTKENLEKRTASVGVDTLKARIKSFEKKHGKVKFPKQFRYKFEHAAPDLSGEGGLRVLGFDPGTANFGCFAGLLVGEDNLRYAEAYESHMLVNPLTDMTRIMEDRVRFRNEIVSYLEEYQPHAIVIERFMTRGLKGATIELVNMMIGIITSILMDYEEQGKFVYLKIVTAASWKNQVNRIINLDTLYAVCRKRGVVDHKLDAALMSMYSFPTKGNPYEFLANKTSRNSFLRSLVAIQDRL